MVFKRGHSLNRTFSRIVIRDYVIDEIMAKQYSDPNVENCIHNLSKCSKCFYKT